jgi:hypothetical protein
MTTTRSQHYTKSTVQASAWCTRCRQMTVHQVLGGKLAGCKVCQKKPDVKSELPVIEQGKLF